MKRSLNVFLAAMTVGTLLTGCSVKEELYAKDVTVELGDDVLLKVDTFVDKENSVLNEETVVTLDTTEFEDAEKYTLDKESFKLTTLGKDYLEVGEYDIVLKANELEATGKLTVEDTTAPEFIDFKDTIKVEENAEKVDLVKYFKANDLSKVEITVEKGNFDIKKPGTYDIKVIATDEYDNKTEKDAKVVVVETEKAEKDGNLTETTDGSTPVSQQTQQNINNGTVTGNMGNAATSGGTTTPSAPSVNGPNNNQSSNNNYYDFGYSNTVNGEEVIVPAGPPGACDASFPAGYMDKNTANAIAQEYVTANHWDQGVWGYMLIPYTNGCGQTYYTIQYKYK